MGSRRWSRGLHLSRVFRIWGSIEPKQERKKTVMNTKRNVLGIGDILRFRSGTQRQMHEHFRTRLPADEAIDQARDSVAHGVMRVDRRRRDALSGAYSAPIERPTGARTRGSAYRDGFGVATSSSSRTNRRRKWQCIRSRKRTGRCC
jgi:hypothetical protein